MIFIKERGFYYVLNVLNVQNTFYLLPGQIHKNA